MKKLVIMAAMLGMAVGAQAQYAYWADELAGASNPTHNWATNNSWWDGGAGFGYTSASTNVIVKQLGAYSIPNGPVINSDVTAGGTIAPINTWLAYGAGGTSIGDFSIVSGGSYATTNLFMADGNSLATVNMTGGSLLAVVNNMANGAGAQATMNNSGDAVVTAYYTRVNNGTATLNLSGTSQYNGVLDTSIGSDAGDVATLNVNLSDTATYSAGALFVGQAGADGTFNMNGGSAVVTDAFAGNNGEGAINVAAGASLDASGTIYAGQSTGTGTMTIDGSATAAANLIAGHAGGTGTIEVNGTADAGTIYAGIHAGSVGVMNVNNGGTATATANVLVGWGGNTDGTLNVNAGGTLNSQGGILVEGGDLNVHGTATAATDIITVGGSTGSINVKNGGILASTGNTISYSDTGAINVEQGGTLNSSAGILAGNGAGATGQVNIDGTANANGWDLIAGWAGSDGEINVGATGVANVQGLVSGHQNNSVGDITIDGTVNVVNSAFAGLSGSGAVGTVTVNAGGLLTVAGNMHLGQGNAGEGYASGILNVDGGTLHVGGLVANVYELVDPDWLWAGGDSQVNLNSGVLWIDNDLAITGFQEHGNIDLEIGATLYIKGDNLAGMGWYESIGALTAVDGTGTILMDYNTTTAGYTTITAIPEPATLGMIALMGGGMLWIRKRFMI